MMKPEDIKRKLGELRENAGKTGMGAFQWFQGHERLLVVAGALVVIVLVVAVVPGRRGDGNAGGGDLGPAVTPAQLASPADASPADAGQMAGNGSNSAQEGGRMRQGRIPGPQLETDQIELLDGLAAALKSRDLEAGGAMLLDNEQKLDYLFYQVMKGEPYLYRDGTLSSELEGEGLVMTRPVAAFYGTFENGMPEGACVAIQGIELDGVRYDYADGIWSGVKLNGEAEAGYHYYNGSGEGESQAVKRIGRFVDDLMDGAFTYETVSSDGEVTVWDMEAEDGRTKFDERWLHDDEKQYYYLPSREIDSHTYVVPDDEAEDIRWRNMLLWGE